MKFKVYIGFLGLRCCNILPRNGSNLCLGQQRLRALFGKLYLTSCGKGVNIQKHTKFSHRCNLGNDSRIGEGSVLYGPVNIGNDVMMGTECLIYTQNHEFSNTTVPMRLQGFQKEKPVTIGNNVWIGGRVTILPGVNIGTGTVIGAGSVVTKDIPPYCVAAGNPARVVKRLRENE